MDGGAWWAAVRGVAKSRTRLSNFIFTFHFHALEKEMATHSDVLPWRIPGTGEPGGLPSMGSHRVGHDWSDLAVAAAYSKYSCNSLGQEIITYCHPRKYLSSVSLSFTTLFLFPKGHHYFELCHTYSQFPFCFPSIYISLKLLTSFWSVSK